MSGYRAWCNEADCGWNEDDFESTDAAIEALARHCLDVHPEAASHYPVVQTYIRKVAAEVAPRNGGLT